ncbi:hypothetical protein GFM14_14660 [Rhizobium leguminosarum bv. viciae]|uniref:hypothetical protein n=1 Tax=Rhizobium leguminosarum TaxID=384 RepID=UPI00144297F4|nr:hypothetical protein [Rhizobium leguminosarum]NKJ92824.1 hypothetical protein [Rhizobium leguminosarum bv. viciae]NKK86679.1 hypothetical protein [Rhizobium leguminosarum bv. viciae]
MNKSLREEYIAYLDRYGLKLRAIPDNFDKMRHAVSEHMFAEAKARGDAGAEMFREIEALTESENALLLKTVHPAQLQIERYAAQVAKNIAKHSEYSTKFAQNVYVGEFPTGSINCQIVKVSGGFLVLMNSGMLVLFRQLAYLLAGKQLDGDRDEDIVNAVAQVLTAYFSFGDPFYGPAPVSGGLKAILASQLSDAVMQFVVGHEYAHLLLGHFDDARPAQEIIQTEVGTIEVLKRSWVQEFEADDLGHRLALGLERYDQIDLAVIDRAIAGNNKDLIDASRIKSEIAAPWLFLGMVALIDSLRDALAAAGAALPSAGTHPPARDRLGKLLHYVNLDGRYNGFMALCGPILVNQQEICVKVLIELKAQGRIPAR